MPFTFLPEAIKASTDEHVLTGKVLTGAFFGPEAVTVRSRDGRTLSTVVLGHGMEHPEGWPVLPEHQRTRLVLRIPPLPGGFVPDLVTGVGCLQTESDRVDVSRYLEKPKFWAYIAELHCATEAIEEPGRAFFGVSQGEGEHWWRKRIQSLHRAGRCPFIRVNLDHANFVELEMAGGIENQDRIWIGDDTRRVLMGYHSGHFSLPAFRPAEVLELARRSGEPRSSVLWLTATYCNAVDEELDKLAAEQVARLPGIRPETAATVAQVLIESCMVPDVAWRNDPSLGWINDSPYSQRNPRSLLSTLTGDDLAFIRSFFV